MFAGIYFGNFPFKSLANIDEFYSISLPEYSDTGNESCICILFAFAEIKSSHVSLSREISRITSM